MASLLGRRKGADGHGGSVGPLSEAANPGNHGGSPGPGLLAGQYSIQLLGVKACEQGHDVDNPELVVVGDREGRLRCQGRRLLQRS